MIDLDAWYDVWICENHGIVQDVAWAIDPATVEAQSVPYHTRANGEPCLATVEEVRVVPMKGAEEMGA